MSIEFNQSQINFYDEDQSEVDRNIFSTDNKYITGSEDENFHQNESSFNLDDLKKSNLNNLSQESKSSKPRKKTKKTQIMCEWCENHFVLKRNMATHLQKCEYYSRLRMKYRDIRDLIDKNAGQVKIQEVTYEDQREELEKYLSEMIKMREENLKIKMFNKDLCEKLNEKQDPHAMYNNKNVEDLIEKCVMSGKTRKLYLQVWRSYVKWIDKNEGPADNIDIIHPQQTALLKSTANSYISELIKEEGQMTSTIKKIRAVLQTILRKASGLQVILNRIAGKKGVVKYKKEKIFLKESQVIEFLKFLKKNYKDYYLPVLIQYKTGTRINAVANIKSDHLLFLNIRNCKNIYLPDSKTIPLETGKYIDKETRKIIQKYYNDNEEKIKQRGGYLFSSGKQAMKICKTKMEKEKFDEEQHYKKAYYLGKKLNEKLAEWAKECKLSKKITTHDIRRSAIQNVREKIYERLVDREASNWAGHTNHKITNKHYKNFKTAGVEERLEIFQDKFNKPKTSCNKNSGQRFNIPEESDNSEDNESNIFEEESPGENSPSIQKFLNKRNKSSQGNEKLLNKKTHRSQLIKFKLDEEVISKQRLYRKISNLYLAESDKNDDYVFNTSFKNALKDRNIKYEENLVFESYDKNNPTNSKHIQNLPKSAVKIYNEFKDRIEKKKYGPLKLVNDPVQGWKVETTKPIKKHTLISEYGGVVRENTREIKDSDSVMNYLNTQNCELVIFPDKIGNLGRFLSGVNNKKIKKSKNKRGKSSEPINHPNCHAQMFNINGSLHVLIYTIRDIEEGETLFYDYNAGKLDEVDTNLFD